MTPLALPALILLLLLHPSTAFADAGRVNFFRLTDSRFAPFLDSPTVDQQAWMRAHYWRMFVFAPHFDPQLAWFPDAWAFKDLYAVYPASPLATSHPEWILRDAGGRPLYIPYQCAKGSCPQYAGDVGNPAFRAQWIAEAVELVAPGYRGLFISDVSLLPRVSNANRRPVRPIDPRTGQPLTDADWGRYVADFCQEIRAALPDREIVHDSLWYVPSNHPALPRQVDSADYIYLQHGFSDRGIRRGKGTYGFDTFLSHIDAVHARGRGVVVESLAKPVGQLEYNLAGYFLVDAGKDGVGSARRGDPTLWWSGYDVVLGDPVGPHYVWQRVHRRDFTNGIVLVNGPGARARTLRLPGAFVDLRNRLRTTVRLGGARGVVLRTQ